MSTKLNICLDLDNTLLYSIDYKENFVKKNKWVEKYSTYKMDKDFIVCERPGLQKFLDWLFKNFKVSVWSAASVGYIHFIVDHVIEKGLVGRNLLYILTTDNCEESQDEYGPGHIKNLGMLWDVYDLPGFGPHNTLIIDDLFKVYKNNPKNCIRIKKFIANKKSYKDNELMKTVKPKLEKIKKHYEKHINDKEFQLL
jgi:TFIIF-interacting CTD phosphatase-like protein